MKASVRGQHRKPIATAMLGFATLGGIMMISASCAESAQEPSVADDTDAGTSTIPSDGDGGASDAGADDAADGGCEGDAETCTTHELPCDEAEWCPSKTNLDPRLGLAAVWGSGKNDVWVVGAQGRVIHWNGADWTPAPTPTTQTLYAVWGSGPNDVWIASSPGVIFHGTGFSGGTAIWSPLPPIADYALVSGSRGKLLRTIWGTSASDVWISGENFTQKSGQPQESSWRSVIVDGGAAWKPMSNCPTTGTCPSISAMWGSGPEDIWAVGPSGAALHTKGIAAGDGGVPNWTAFDSQASGELRSVWGSGPGDVWAVGAGGTIRRYTTGAERWTIVASPTKEHLNAIWGTGPNDIWAVGDHGMLLHYDGTHWTTSTAAFAVGPKPHLRGVWGSGPNDVWAVGDGIVLHFSGPKPRAQGAAQ